MNQAAETILLVDDNPDDVFLVERALRETGLPNPLVVGHDGLEALRYLNGEAPSNRGQQPTLPMLVLLDLDLPGINGFEVLARLRRQPQLSKLPVIVFTGSSMSPDVARVYRLGANSFVAKPAQIEQLKTMLVEVVRTWSIAQANGESQSTQIIPQPPQTGDIRTP